jgi:hypothetical protein
MTSSSGNKNAHSLPTLPVVADPAKENFPLQEGVGQTARAVAEYRDDVIETHRA